MIIPDNRTDRLELFIAVQDQCNRERMSRVYSYSTMANYYLHGSGDGSKVVYNKIGGTIDLLASFIYSAAHAKFTLTPGQEINKDELTKVGPLVTELEEIWKECGAAGKVGQAVLWSLVYGCSLIQCWYDQGMQVRFIDPSGFGVYLENIPDLERQPAVTYRYYIERSQLYEQLKDHPHREALIGRLDYKPELAESAVGQGGSISQVIVNTQYPFTQASMTGGLNEGDENINAFAYQPVNNEQLIELYEMFIWNTETCDWHVVTMALPDIIIFDRPNFYAPKKLPFIKFCPYPLYFYFWGKSFCDQLAMLQDWYTTRIAEVQKILSIQANTPKAIYGAQGIKDEKMLALNRPGGLVPFPDTSAKVQEFQPQMPPDIFSELDKIDAMFDDAAGITAVMKGRGEQGVRAKGHADTLARLSSSRTREVALCLEKSIGDLAHMMMQLIQQHSETELVTAEKLPDGKPFVFIPAQFTDSYHVGVDAHSSSPIFSEDKKEDAVLMLKAKAIDRESFLELIDPPSLNILKERLKKIEEGEHRAHQQQLKEDIILAEAKHSK